MIASVDELLSFHTDFQLNTIMGTPIIQLRARLRVCWAVTKIMGVFESLELNSHSRSKGLRDCLHMHTHKIITPCTLYKYMD